tara:strand:+ start:139 stop:264 length:126 start_codon:yes stop_codon:yes gene_type:complete
MYKLYWKNEMIDETNTYDQALYLLKEYNMAYNGGVSLKIIS